MIDDVVRAVLVQVDGARCVLLAGSDGVVVSSAVAGGGPAPDVVAAALAEAFRRVAAAHREAGLVPPLEIASLGPNGQAAVRAVTSEYFLASVLDPAGSLGRARYELRKAAAALEPELI